MTWNYLAFIIGGEGPDVWDREVKISAVDFMDAATQAQGRAEELHGWLCDVSQNDEDRPPREDVRARCDDLKKGLHDLIVVVEEMTASDEAAVADLKKFGDEMKIDLTPDTTLVEKVKAAVLKAKGVYYNAPV